MELVKSGTLMSFMKYCRIKRKLITDENCSCIMKQILEGITYIHGLNIVHRDIKPQNILMRSFQSLQGAVRIADFGLGTKADSTVAEKCGTLSYMAPELLARTAYGKVMNANNH